MSQSVTLNGVIYSIPDVDEEDWGQNVTDYLVALSVIASATQAFMTTVNVTSTPVTVVMGRTYLVDTSAIRTLQLPAASTNFYFIVKDKTGTAFTNNITIARAAAESIDGVAANKTLKVNSGCWMLVSDGTNWFTLNIKDDFVDALNDGATPAATAADLKVRLDQIVTQIKSLSGEANWYTATTARLKLSGGTMTGALVLANLAADPAAPGEGTIYYNTVDKQFYGWNGTSWAILG